ncbi:endo alpha-1,4 polygalactosaminidase [Bacteroidota bacterium]
MRSVTTWKKSSNKKSPSMHYVAARYISVILSIFLMWSCGTNEHELPPDIDFRQEMRDFVMDMSAYAKSIHPDFIIIPQNGQELITDNGESDGIPETLYLNAIDATGREDLLYGYDRDDRETPEEDIQHMLDLCLICVQNNVKVLVTDYCSTPDKMDNSYQLNEQYGFISFAAEERDLNSLPSYPDKPYNENAEDIQSISQARNFLYLINSGEFDSRQDFISAVSETNFDAVIIDLFHDEASFTSGEIAQLKVKQNGAKRLVICYMSIGEAEDYRFYWQKEWKIGNPVWLEKENPDWDGNYKVRYWEPDWQKIIYGTSSSYLDKILDIDFDGVYLDIIDGFEYFEEWD